MKNYFLAFIIISFVACTSAPPIALIEDDVIFTNGNVLTIDEEFSIAKSIVVRDEKIIYVGEDFDHNNENVETIDLEGKTLMPGLIEPHTHPAASAGLYQWVDVSGITHKTAEDALDALRKAASQTPEGKWILAFGWDAMLLEGAYPPYREVLDEISQKHPIWVMMQSMHSHYFNSYAFDMAGIKDDIVNPPGGGYYEKDENGKLTGLITENAPLAPILKIMDPTPEAVLVGMLKSVYKKYNSYGVTTIGVTGLIDALLPRAESMIQDLSTDDPSLRVFMYRVGGLDYSDRAAFEDNDYYQFLGTKYWSDGSPYTGSMLLSEPYTESDLSVNKLSIDAGSFGHIMLPLNVFDNLVSKDAAAGFQISIHAQGDSACTNTLNVLESALHKNPKEDHRYRMEHLALINKEHLSRMSELNIYPSFHINHVHYYGDFLGRIVGDRADKFMPLKDAVNAGLKISLHNDSPMYPPNPLLAVQTAVTRKTLNGRPLGESQAIDIEEALRAVTINAAWQVFAEDRIGSLVVGKQADLVILKENPLTINPDQIGSIEVQQVYLAGRKVF